MQHSRHADDAELRLHARHRLAGEVVLPSCAPCLTGFACMAPSMSTETGFAPSHAVDPAELSAHALHPWVDLFLRLRP